MLPLESTEEAPTAKSPQSKKMLGLAVRVPLPLSVLSLSTALEVRRGQAVTKILLREAGVPTPEFRVVARPDDDLGDLHYPLIVKPRHESTSYGLRLVHDRKGLSEAVGMVVAFDGGIRR